MSVEIVSTIPAVATASVPRWVRTVDGLAIALFCLAVLLIPGDGVRFEVAGIRIAISSALRVAAWAVVLVVGRHLVLPRPALTTRAWHWLQGETARRELPAMLRLTVATRLPIIAIGFLAVGAIPLGTDLGSQNHDNAWLNLLARWDAVRYSDIARSGYAWDGNPIRQQNVVFFPGFPLAIHAVSRFFNIHSLYAAWLISMAAFAWAMVLFVRMARLFTDPDAATDAAWLLSCYPFAFFFGAAYSESLFLLTMCGLFLSMHRQQFWRAAVWGLAAGLTRPNGWLLGLPVAILAVYTLPRPRDLPNWLRRGVPAAAPAVGALLFTLYLQLRFGDGLAWVKGQAAWGRTFRGLHLFFADRILIVRDLGLTGYLMEHPVDVLNTAGALFALALIIPIGRRLGLAYGVLAAVLVVPPLLMGGSTSMGRLTAILFPMFIWLAAVLPRERRTALMVVFATIQGFAATLFYTYRTLY
jgi:Mannosyltransferase (PIG-V)